MASGHNGKPKNQGSFGPVHTSKPMTSAKPGSGEAPKSTQKQGIHVKGIGGTGKSF